MSLGGNHNSNDEQRHDNMASLQVITAKHEMSRARQGRIHGLCYWCDVGYSANNEADGRAQ